MPVPRLTGKQAVSALTGFVLYHEFTCLHQELISYEIYRMKDRRPWLVSAFIVATAAHLLHVLPRRLDPYGGFGFPILSKLKGH